MPDDETPERLYNSYLLEAKMELENNYTSLRSGGGWEWVGGDWEQNYTTMLSTEAMLDDLTISETAICKL